MSFSKSRARRTHLPTTASTAPCFVRSAKPWRCGYSALARFKLNIDGDRIAGWKRCFQRFVKQFIQMCRRGCRTFLRFFLSEHDFGAFFAFVSLYIGCLHRQPKGGASFT
jgi:hypothetical protein